MAYKKIWLLGEPIVRERVAAADIRPGALVITNSSGNAAVHATAGGDTGPAFALENEMFGKGITDTLKSGDLIQIGIGRPGDIVYGLLAAAASAVVVGDQLESAGDGTLRKRNTGKALAIAQEAVDNSAGATVVNIAAQLI